MESAVTRQELAVGTDQIIVVYEPADIGVELDAAAIYGEVAADAERRAASGWRIVSIDSMNLRHSAVAFGRDGSGYATKAAVTVVYARV